MPAMTMPRYNVAENAPLNEDAIKYAVLTPIGDSASWPSLALAICGVKQAAKEMKPRNERYIYEIKRHNNYIIDDMPMLSAFCDARHSRASR